ncbi:MAG TPA: hypothetical protein VFS46_07465 [Nitrososphaera sp.]|nr:hypothetical protein [Nitrososphaera sp.]
MPIEFSRPARQAFSSEFKTRIMQVYSLFPELQEKTIACGLLKKRGAVEGTAASWTLPPVFRLRPNVSSYTIAHELIHLVQGNGSGVPHGEVACDIWAVDRLPAELLDQRPYYLMKNSRCDWKKNRDTVKELCRQAIEIRKTRRTYIVWLRGQIIKLDGVSRAR